MKTLAEDMAKLTAAGFTEAQARAIIELINEAQHDIIDGLMPK